MIEKNWKVEDRRRRLGRFLLLVSMGLMVYVGTRLLLTSVQGAEIRVDPVFYYDFGISGPALALAWTIGDEESAAEEELANKEVGEDEPGWLQRHVPARGRPIREHLARNIFRYLSFIVPPAVDFIEDGDLDGFGTLDSRSDDTLAPVPIAASAAKHNTVQAEGEGSEIYLKDASAFDHLLATGGGKITVDFDTLKP